MCWAMHFDHVLCQCAASDAGCNVESLFLWDGFLIVISIAWCVVLIAIAIAILSFISESCSRMHVESIVLLPMMIETHLP